MNRVFVLWGIALFPFLVGNSFVKSRINPWYYRLFPDKSGKRTEDKWLKKLGRYKFISFFADFSWTFKLYCKEIVFAFFQNPKSCERYTKTLSF